MATQDQSHEPGDIILKIGRTALEFEASVADTEGVLRRGIFDWVQKVEVTVEPDELTKLVLHTTPAFFSVVVPEENVTRHSTELKELLEEALASGMSAEECTNRVIKLLTQPLQSVAD